MPCAMRQRKINPVYTEQAIRDNRWGPENVIAVDWKFLFAL